MKRLLCCFMLLSALCFAQGNGYNSYQSNSFTVTGSGPAITQNTTILYHEITWTVTGAPAACTVAVDSSPDKVTWTPGGIITGQACTANGQSAIVNLQANYVRVTVTALSAGGTLNLNYIGWSYNPTGAGASPGGPAGGDLSGTYPNPSVANAAFNVVSAGTNTNALRVGTGGTLFPTVLGQIAGTQGWLYPSLAAPSISFSTTGGTIASSQTVRVVYTLTNAAGDTNPSAESTVSTSACVGGNQCSVTVTAPTIPTGFTGYTVWSLNSTNPWSEKKQIAANACVNIVGNCVIQTPGTGTVVANANTAWASPTPLGTSTCPTDITPFWFMQDNAGNWQTQAGLDPFFDATNGPPSPGGTLTFCRRVWFNDTLTSPFVGKNAFVGIAHSFNGTTTSLGNQDRALSIVGANAVGDVTQHYSLTGQQTEVDINGTPTFVAANDAEIATGSFQMSDTHTGAIGPGGRIHGIRTDVFRSGTGTVTGCLGAFGVCETALEAKAIMNNGATFGGGGMAAIVAGYFDQAGQTASANGFGIYILRPSAISGGRFNGNNFGLLVENYGTNTADWNIFSQSIAGTSTNGRNWFAGDTYMTNVLAATNTIGVGNSLLFTGGGIQTTQLATPSNPQLSVIGGTGATTWQYKLVGRDVNGDGTAVSAQTQVVNGPATLTGANYIQICLPNVYPVNTSNFDVYRTVAGGTPNTTGKIGNIAALNATSAGSGFCLNDQALAGDGSTPQTINTTAATKSYKHNTLTACAASGTAANPSVVTCAAAPAGIIYCDVAASAGTCVVNTSAVTTNSIVHVMPSVADGTLLSKTCNTTPSATPFSLLSAKSNGVSFTINMPTVTVNGVCFEYYIIN